LPTIAASVTKRPHRVPQLEAGFAVIGDGAQITDEMLEACVRGHTINDARPKIGGDRLITMGADQGKTGYISVVDWTFDQHPGSDINAAAIGKLLWFGKFP
jgi:hypothetical protein